MRGSPTPAHAMTAGTAILDESNLQPNIQLDRIAPFSTKRRDRSFGTPVGVLHGPEIRDLTTYA
jgi:hypothetical protein